MTAVVDALVAKETGFDPERNLPCLKEVWIARDAADQRKGLSLIHISEPTRPY